VHEFVRAATLADVTALCALEVEARAAVAAAQRGGPQWLGEHPELGSEGWTDRLADSSCVTAVAGVDEVVLGMATMRCPQAGSDLAVATVDSIYVTPEAREIGLGEMLLATMIDGAADAGASSIEASALPGDRDTKNLFERFGLVARLIVVSRALTRPQDHGEPAP
jgi:L-amino acid N-acyltransferase YncA